MLRGPLLTPEFSGVGLCISRPRRARQAPTPGAQPAWRRGVRRMGRCGTAHLCGDVPRPVTSCHTRNVPPAHLPSRTAHARLPPLSRTRWHSLSGGPRKKEKSRPHTLDPGRSVNKWCEKGQCARAVREEITRNQNPCRRDQRTGAVERRGAGGFAPYGKKNREKFTGRVKTPRLEIRKPLSKWVVLDVTQVATEWFRTVWENVRVTGPEAQTKTVPKPPSAGLKKWYAK